MVNPDRSFFDVLSARCESINSILCVGLDPHDIDVQKIVEETGLDAASAAEVFCTRIIAQTHHVAAAYKPNAAFFEAIGVDGVRALHRIIAKIPKEIPVLLDAKRGDISSTARAYASACFDVAQAHAVTVHPYMGRDSVEPFAKDSSKGVFVLCKTSNPSSNDFETLPVTSSDGKTASLYEVVAAKCMEWDDEFGGNIGLVVGATDVEALANVRKAAPRLWILAPGVGFQGGNLSAAASAGLRPDGLGMLVPVSRGISRAEDPKAAAEGFCASLNDVRGTKRAGSLLPYQQKFIKLSLECRVLRFGSFTLKSGRTSPYFFNAGLFCGGRSLHELGKCYAETIVRSGIKYDVIFGPAYKGITLAAAIASSLYADHGIDVPFAYNRKEAKDHGEGGVLVGAPIKGKRVLLADDVITGGTAIRESVALLKANGASPAGVVIALDRQELVSKEATQSAVQSVQSEFDIPVVSIASLSNLLQYLKSGGFDDLLLNAVVDYRDTYGIKE